MSITELTLTRTVTAIDGTNVTWETVVKNDTDQDAIARLGPDMLVPQDVAPASLQLVEGPYAGEFDLASRQWDLRLPSGTSGKLTLSADKVSD